MAGLIKVFIDSNRDGTVTENDIGQQNWVWAEDSPGAIITPNIDKDINEQNPLKGKSELAKVLVKEIPSHSIPSNVHLMLSVSENTSRRITVYRENAQGELEYLIGVDPTTNNAFPTGLVSTSGETLYLEAKELPNADFEGLITLEFLFLEQVNGQYNYYQMDRNYANCVFRVAPWIMTPNTQPAKQVFTVKLEGVNDMFLAGLQSACDEAGVPLKIIDGDNHNSDRWIQDEIEFGYCESPIHQLPVVLDSPRNRGLRNFAKNDLLAEDFGHFELSQPHPVNSLDSFGNLEVSPPVTVGDRTYPLGRIVIGGKQFNHFGDQYRQMMPQLRRLLHAQKVQSPIEVYSDWLLVGHIDEFINFIPDTNSEKGFKLMLASPSVCRDKLLALQNDGHGQVTMFEGQKRYNDLTRSFDIDASITIDEYLADDGLMKTDQACQGFIDYNEQVLKKELGLDDNDIIYAPVTFKPASPSSKYVLAFFPDMVNHLILNKFHVIPKPYGPKINGQDVFEQMMIDVLPNTCEARFIDDWKSYHEASGEVHCGTNTLREPFSNVKWWEHMPSSGFNI